jgi:hypothetical protein
LPDRRDFLHAMLGAAAASAAGCRRLRPIPGRIVGASAEVGHRVRSLPSLGEPTRTERVPIVILGAGPSGLSAAWRLARLGAPRSVVLDLEPEMGGTSRFGRDGVVPYPWGAHYLPVPRRDNVGLVTLLRELGAIVGEDEHGEPVPAEEMVVREPEERIFFRGAWHEGLWPKEGETELDRRDRAAFLSEVGRLSAVRDGRGRRAFDLPMERGSDDPDVTVLDRLTMADWLREKGLTSPRLRWLVDYACRDDYGLRADDTSAWAGLFYWVSRVSGPGREAAPLLAWPNGNGRLVEHLAASARPDLRLGHVAMDVATFDDRAEVTVLDVTTQTTVRFVADRVIFALPKLLAPHLLRTVRDEKPSWPGAFRYGAWMVANAHLDAHPRSDGAALAWDNVLYDSASLGYVVATHQHHVDEGPTVLTYYFPYTDAKPEDGRRRLYEADHAQLVDLMLTDLGPAHHGLSGQIQRVDVMRWGHAMAQPRPGFVWGSERRAASRPIGRVHMAHADLSGLALFEEAFFHGVRAAEEAFSALYPDRPLARLAAP